jgi:hypothetical protein
MGQVIPFKPRARTSRQTAAPMAGGAQILFFLGVRYSRIEDERDFPATQEPDQDSGQGSGRKRRKRVRG